MPSNNNEKDINPGTSNNGKKEIRSVYTIDNNNEDIKPADIDK